MGNGSTIYIIVPAKLKKSQKSLKLSFVYGRSPRFSSLEHEVL
jgi:hypothetical protein